MKLQDYLRKNRITELEFAAKSKISLATIYKACKGHRIYFSTALKIEDASNGEVSIKELGFDYDE